MNIRFSGFGGQGVILSGVILGYAALLDGRNAIQTQSYGSSARGGACKCDVIISDTAIYELEPSQIDILISFSQPAYDKFSHSLKAGGQLFVDSDLVQSHKHSADILAIPATDIAFKEMDNKIIANIVMLGCLSGRTKLISAESMEKSVRHYVPEKFTDTNIKAFRRGMELASHY